MLRSTRRACRDRWLIVALSLACLPCHASEDGYKYRAIMAKYFISQHSAIPLFSNSAVKSGSVLLLRTEATRYSRQLCYSLDEPSYRELGKFSVASQGAASLDMSGSATAYKVLDVVGKAGATTTNSDRIDLSLSQEEPQRGGVKGLSLLFSPRPACAEVPALLAGSPSHTILVTRVFWGTAQARTSIGMAGTIDVDARARLGKDLAKILGATPQISADAAGHNVVIQINSTTQARSLAVQSAIVNPEVLARVYTAANGQNGTLAKFENQVAEYLGADRSAAQTIATGIRSMLIELKIIKRDPQEFYDDLFSGTKPPGAPVNCDNRDAKVWEAVGTVASAVEIARSAAEPALVRR